MNLRGYYQQDGKGRKLLGHFAEGVAKTGDRMTVMRGRFFHEKPHDPTVLYGVDRSTGPIYNAMTQRGAGYVYIDNCYLGRRRDRYSVTWNGIRCTDPNTEPGECSNGRRFDELGLRLHPWRTGGRHILIALQSALYFELIVGIPRESWIRFVIATLRKHTDRPIIIREKPSWADLDAGREIPPLESHLEFCHAVVCWNSMVGVRALMAGIPAFAMDPNCCYGLLAPPDLHRIEDPFRSSQRRKVLGWLADNQWSMSEFRSGRAWGTLREHIGLKDGRRRRTHSG